MIKNLARRRRSEFRFKLCGLAAITFALAALCFLLIGIVYQAWGSLSQTVIDLEVSLSDIDPAQPDQADYRGIVRQSLRNLFPDQTSRQAQKEITALLSSAVGDILAAKIKQEPSPIGTKPTISFIADDKVDQWRKDYKGTGLSDNQIFYLQKLEEQGYLKSTMNWGFFTEGDSREPEQAGIGGAFLGSLWTMLITMALALPLGIMGAIYLEEFAPRNRLTDWIEVNINNLAAVPSIVFGLLGLALFLNWFGLPRSSPLVGGLVLSLMILPAIIVSTRLSLRAVPPSIREAALGMGASSWQVVLHHVLPLSVSGIMTGSILGLSRALGETAPLLMIGMVAFIADIPKGPLDPATVLPVQIFLWSDSPEQAFTRLSAAAILFLLFMLLGMNAIAIFIRQKFAKRW